MEITRPLDYANSSGDDHHAAPGFDILLNRFIQLHLVGRFNWFLLFHAACGGFGVGCLNVGYVLWLAVSWRWKSKTAALDEVLIEAFSVRASCASSQSLAIRHAMRSACALFPNRLRGILRR